MGITIDDEEIFLLNLKKTIQKDENGCGLVEQNVLSPALSESRENSSRSSGDESLQGPNKKRRKRKRKSSGSAEQYDQLHTDPHYLQDPNNTEYLLVKEEVHGQQHLQDNLSTGKCGQLDNKSSNGYSM